MTGPTGRPEATPPSRDKPGRDKPSHDKHSRDKHGRDKAERDNPGSAGRRGRVGGKRRSERADPARRAVFDVLLAVAKRGAYANLLLPSVLRERRLGGRDAALATELCYGTLRGQGTYDAILSVCSDRRIARMDPPVREVLRLGVHQLLATRVATHAAVATSVDLAKDVAGVRPAGFVNAVLRRVSTRNLDDWMSVVAPGRQADPVGYLAVRHSYPPWIVTAFGAALGELPLAAAAPDPAAPDPAAPAAAAPDPAAPAAAAPDPAALDTTSPAAAPPPAATPSGDGPAGGLVETEAALAAGNIGPRVTLCAIPGVCAPGELTAVPGSEPARWSPFGVYLAHGDPAAITAVSQRRATVQDEASQLAALALTRAEVTGPDRLWLDMCAGPGGKAALLAGIAADRGARLLAADAREHRAALAREVLARDAPAGSPPGPAAASPARPAPAAGGIAAGAAAGGATAGVVVADGTAPAWRQGVFDRVLADVPCSGLGSLRRRPEARWRRSADQFAELAPLQRSLLRVALVSVRPGGVVAYVTCSPHLAETRDVLADVLGGRQDVEVLDAPALLPEVPDLGGLAPFSKHVQFWPHRHKTDAIFLALIRRLG